MRLWSLHPSLLDAKGLVALWREALLAQAVLAGRTKGYRQHPQIDRFKSSGRPLSVVAAYLDEIQKEATRRGYGFDRKKIRSRVKEIQIEVTAGQLCYEFEHLKRKLKVRDKAAYQRIKVERVFPHPLFRLVPGEIEEWEVVSPVLVSRRKK